MTACTLSQRRSRTAVSLRMQSFDSGISTCMNFWDSSLYDDESWSQKWVMALAGGTTVSSGTMAPPSVLMNRMSRSVQISSCSLCQFEIFFALQVVQWEATTHTHTSHTPASQSATYRLVHEVALEPPWRDGAPPPLPLGCRSTTLAVWMPSPGSVCFDWLTFFFFVGFCFEVCLRWRKKFSFVVSECNIVAGCFCSWRTKKKEWKAIVELTDVISIQPMWFIDGSDRAATDWYKFKVCWFIFIFSIFSSNSLCCSGCSFLDSASTILELNLIWRCSKTLKCIARRRSQGEYEILSPIPPGKRNLY